MIFGRAAVAAAALAALSAAGCGSKLPEIPAIEWRLESRPAESGPAYESLSVFASVKDEDGIDGIDELWLLNDESSLGWKLTGADWIKATEGGDTWIGGSSLAVPSLSAMPRGEYRLIVIDLAGQRAEKAFRVAGDFPRRKAPSLGFTGGRLSVSSTWPETLALAFDGAGALLASPAAPAGPASLAVVLGAETAARTAEVGAYGYDPGLRMGAFSTRVKTR